MLGGRPPQSQGQDYSLDSGLCCSNLCDSGAQTHRMTRYSINTQGKGDVLYHTRRI